MPSEDELYYAHNENHSLMNCTCEKLEYSTLKEVAEPTLRARLRYIEAEAKAINRELEQRIVRQLEREDRIKHIAPVEDDDNIKLAKLLNSKKFQQLKAAIQGAKHE